MSLTVAELLTAYKAESGLGDKRLADRANEYAEVALLHRSSIRNWSNGSSLVARNWRQVAAIAAALRLDEQQASELLAAAGCPTVAELRLMASGQDCHLLRFWERPGEVSSPGVDAEGVSAPSDGSVRRRVPAFMAAAALVLVTLVGIAGAFELMQNEPDDEVLDQVVLRDAGATGTAGASLNQTIPAVAQFRAPANGAVVGTELALSGTAGHPNGVSHVHMIIQRLDEAIFWNPDDQIWQQKFRTFVIAVDEPGAPEANWLVLIDGEHPLPPGPYRARVWAAASDGNLDPVGELIEFSVAERADQNNPAVAVARESQLNPRVDVRRQAEDQGLDIVKVRVRQPFNGLTRADGALRLVAFAEHAAGVDLMRVEVFDVDRERYWNFEANRWQGSATALEITEPPVDGDGTRLSVDQWLPDGVAPPGRYRVTAFGTAAGAEPFVDGEVSEVTLLGG